MWFKTPSQQLIYNNRQKIIALQDEINQAMSHYESKQDIIVLTQINVTYTEITIYAVLKELDKNGWRVVQGSVNKTIPNGFITRGCWVIASKELIEISSEEVLQRLGAEYYNWQPQI